MIRCKCKRIDDIDHLQRVKGSPILSRSVEDFQERSPVSKQIKAHARKFIEQPAGMFTIWGINGSGKTTLLMGIAQDLRKKGIKALYIRTADLLSYIKAGIDMPWSPDDRIGEISDIPVLCLDELTQAFKGEWTSERLERIIDNRYLAGSGTVLAMDEDPANRLHPRIVSRINSGPVVEIDDSDLRPLIGGNL
jgi:DNA replication protein DnaC